MTQVLKEYKVNLDKDQDFRKCIDLIMNSIYFRKLADKTQVIISLTGPNVRTRLTHTIEVSNIARELCYNLGLNENLAEAISLAHDIGHTPFGHVGERTLKEVMCGCDNLKNKISFDFANSGFKHNLQSFKILYDYFGQKEDLLEQLYFIFWGAAAHSKMSYSPLGASVDNEILIHNGHCSNLYNCNLSFKENETGNALKECKFNERFEVGANNQHDCIFPFRREKKKTQVCKPWYCAKLNDLNRKEEISHIKEEDQYNWANTFCYRKCYFAKIWEYRISNKDIYDNFDYLFDHPFPNTYYAELFNNAFYKSRFDFISFESFIVSEADEIAQRKQDLEDGLTQKLIQFEQFDELKDIFKIEKSKENFLNFFINSKDEIQNRLLRSFANIEIQESIKLIFNNFDETNSDLKKFILSDFGTQDIQVLYNLVENKIIKDRDLNLVVIRLFVAFVKLNDLNNSLFNLKNDYLHNIDEINTNFRKNVKNENNYSNSIKKTSEQVYRIFFNSLLFNIEVSKKFFFDEPTFPLKLKKISLYNIFDFVCEIQKEDIKHKYCISESIIDLEQLKKFENGEYLLLIEKLKDSFNLENTRIDEIQRKEYILLKVYENLDYRLKRGEEILCIERIKELISEMPESIKTEFIEKLSGTYKLVDVFSLLKSIEGYKSKSDFLNLEFIYINQLSLFDFKLLYESISNNEISNKEIFAIWKSKFKTEANQIVTNRFSINDDYWFGNSLKNLEKYLKNTVLKSEIVEKNDGKASYIIKKLFEAYLTNPHQLPDAQLSFLGEKLIQLNDKLKTEAKEYYKVKLNAIKDKTRSIIDTSGLSWENKNKIDESEVKTYPKELIELFNAKNDLLVYLDDNQTKPINKIRKHIDNTILISLNLYKNKLYRTICNHIASLTDREALNEFEKLYSGIMEIA